MLDPSTSAIDWKMNVLEASDALFLFHGIFANALESTFELSVSGSSKVGTFAP